MMALVHLLNLLSASIVVISMAEVGNVRIVGIAVQERMLHMD